MSSPLLLIQNLSYSFGGHPLFTDLNFNIANNEKLCLVGRNGSGKSTLFKIIMGLQNRDSGNLFIQPGTTIQCLSQEPDLSYFTKTIDYVCSELPSPDDHFRGRILLEALGLTGNENPAHLSGGETRRCALAKVLAPRPDLLLLDEPTNHLDLPTIEWLESELKSLSSAVLMISHDRRFLDNMAKGIIWLDRGQARQLSMRFSEFELWRENFFEQEALEYHKLNRQIAREEDWVRYGVTARRKRNVRRMAELSELRLKRKNHIQNPSLDTLQSSDAENSGKIVIDAKNITKSYNSRTIINNLNLRIVRGDRLGIIGPNGAGKSTLLKLLTEQELPDQGEIKLGSKLEINYLDQHRQILDPEKTLAETLTRGRGDYVDVGGEKKHVIGYMKQYLFQPEQAKTPVKVLSGGEKARLLLACALSQPSNLMILDEPTNDFDLETLDLLQEVLSTYKGTLILVSHDRDFLDRIATSVLVAEGDGIWTEYAGGYSDMMALHEYKQENLIRKTQNKSQKSTYSKIPIKPKPKKLSYKDQYELDHLPEKLQKLQISIMQLNQHLNDPGLYQKDPDLFEKFTRQLLDKQKEQEKLEERWLELEILQENLKSNDELNNSFNQ